MKTLKNNWPFWVIVVVAFLGILNAGYLTMQHYRGLAPNCSILHGCDTVTSSEYSIVLGIPVALLGLIFYLVFFFLALAYMRDAKPMLGSLLWLSAAVGIIVSAVLVCLQIFVIGALCQYCIISAAEATILFIFSSYLISLQRSTGDISL